LVNGILQLRLLFWRQVINGDVHDVASFRHLDSTRVVPLGMPKSVLTQNRHLTPSTQQAERSWLNTRDELKACQSIFLKLTKEIKYSDNKLGTCRVVPDSSIFTARKPIKVIYSYNKLSINSSNSIRELLYMKTWNSRMDGVSMMIDQSLFK
jgi:hypothetical protein